MVKLDKIYTRGGDRGETSLSDGTRTPKHSLRIHAQGEADEANAAIGLARLHVTDPDTAAMLDRVQNDMFDLGADISRPGDDPGDGNLRIQPVQVERLEREIDSLNEALEPLTSFVLRGGTAVAAHLHFACTVVRRAERAAGALAAAEPVNPRMIAYLNRLSDLLFVMARHANDGGRAEILWRPGLTAET
jgi:cob(I)alamin adenosyltransferase